MLTVYAKGKKGITQGKKATTQDEKDILGTKNTKQSHSGQKGRKSTFLALSFLEDLSRLESREGLPRIVSDFYELGTFHDMNDRFAFAFMSFIYISRRLACS